MAYKKIEKETIQKWHIKEIKKRNNKKMAYQGN